MAKPGSDLPSARDQILRSAISIFSRKGFAATGVQEILDPVRLSKPTLYYYFESKAGLFKAILDHAFQEYFELIESAVARQESCEEKLIAAASALFDFTIRNEDLTRLVFATVFAAPDEVPEGAVNSLKRRRIFDLITALFTEAQSRREINSAFDPEDLAHGFLGGVSHRTRGYLLNQTGPLDQDLARRIVTLFLNGARYSPASARLPER